MDLRENRGKEALQKSRKKMFPNLAFDHID